MTRWTYEEIAIKEGIVLCGDCWVGSQCLESIDRGERPGNWANIASGTMHWQNRKLTKPGFRNFLKLWASIYLNHNRGQAKWEILHQQNAQAYRKARYYGVILPKRLSRNDRQMALLAMESVRPKPQPAYQWAKEEIR